MATTLQQSAGAATARPWAGIDARLLDDWQRDLPLVSRPFAALGNALGISEAEVIERLSLLHSDGIVARVGGVIRPNTLGASTLAAIAVRDLAVEEIAGLLAEYPGINHIYLRENVVNLWFVVTGPELAYVEETLESVGRRTGLAVLDLRLEQPYHIDLGFGLRDSRRRQHSSDWSLEEAPDVSLLDAWDRALAQTLADGLPLIERPFDDIGNRLGLSEADVLARLDRLVRMRVVPRVGVIVRHRALGWRSNAMVVWDVEPEDTTRAGRLLSSVPGVNLCYRRTRYPRAWPYNLYCMVHARSRDEALEIITTATETAGLRDHPRQILFSVRCFKQTGAFLALREVH